MYVCGGRAPVSVVLTKADMTLRWCCMAAAEDGAEHCTCWEPIFDAEQKPPRTRMQPKTRAKACHDCAYRQGSPERERGDDLEALDNFWCHQGIRRPAAYRHPDGRVRPVADYLASGDYQPPMLDVPYRADGRPADRCAGWAAVVERRRAEAAA
jgi:hypothetical protein